MACDAAAAAAEGRATRCDEVARRRAVAVVVESIVAAGVAICCDNVGREKRETQLSEQRRKVFCVAL